MQITVNGEARDLPVAQTLAELVEALGLGGRRIAVERNGEIVPRSRYAATVLDDGDELLIVHAIGGG
ncbi:sulfur carrier protein ThiS [Sinimarinibacterium thermocellulolyticum]|uniref:Sulfur carrier protein ThiS n=1 Tax=Sinimarinibacterium thermocellulolyticum TaxID=3170016 RepID=A0ABV2ABY0_9GAMM